VIAALQPLVASEQENLPALKVTRLPTSRQQLTDVLDHNDSVVSWYIQGGSRNYEDRALYALTAQAMKSGFFQQLRTEQQLGYIASAFSWAQNDVPAVVMIIQSPSHSSKAVYQAMETFVKEVPSTIDAAAFERHRMALVAEITEPHKNLWERAEFFWSSMGQGDYSFESRDKLAAAVEAITYENWLEFFRAEFIDSPRSLLVIAPGQFADSVSEPTIYDSAQQVKEGNDSFSITLSE
jgi:insulysin